MAGGSAETATLLAFGPAVKQVGGRRALSPVKGRAGRHAARLTCVSRPQATGASVTAVRVPRPLHGAAARAGTPSNRVDRSELPVASVLLLYSSVYGLSRQICERIQSRLVAQGQRAEVVPIANSQVDPAAFDAIVIGASIRHGKHNPAVLQYIRSHKDVLESRPGALFSVNLVARKPGKNTPQTNPYLKALVAQSPWKPKLQGVFAGELDYSRYGPVDRQLMRLVMWINKGPTDPHARVQFTNWAEVERFAGQVAQLATGRTG
jgi:menaquinone-dependent protoporphyrinogen oxidase